MNLHTELADIRTQIRDIRLDMSRLAYQGWPREARHNTEGRLARLTAYETELIERIESEEQRTEALISAAVASGNPTLFTLAYLLVGTAPEAA